LKIYFAGDGYDDIIQNEKHILKSFFYIKGIKTQILKNFMLDSGGFSAYTRGIVIDINDYIGFVIKNKNIISDYFVLDDITDYKKTMENQKYMETKGLTPIPCYHTGEPLSVLEYYCKNYDYISLGDLVPYARSKKKLIQILDNCFSVISKYFPIKVHGLGMTNKTILEKYPFYSVDSTSWLEGARSGKIRNYDKSNVNLLTEYKYKDKDSLKLYKSRTLFMAKEQLKLEEYITKLWAKRGIVWNE
tara:strand:- start:108 stop:845 length:738 start_codon:yes stop_codon:yes gene_type:complete